MGGAKVSIPFEAAFARTNESQFPPRAMAGNQIEIA
jgi:hypothetical protein